MKISSDRLPVLGHAVRADRATVLVPCIFLLSLLSVLSIGLLRTSGTGTATNALLTEQTQARLMAESGIELAYRRLSEDLEYRGEVCSPFEAFPDSISISVADLGSDRFEVVSVGEKGDSQCRLRTWALARQWVYEYPLSVGRDLTWQGGSKILGDCYVKRRISGSSPAMISGDLHLPGDHEITYDSSGNPIRIDGYRLPALGGEVHTNAPEYEFPDVDLSDLRAAAAASGQIFTGRVTLTNKEFDGVVYLENCSTTPKLKNVIINGVLVADRVSVLEVSDYGYLKITSNPAVCENVAILAPNT